MSVVGLIAFFKIGTTAAGFAFLVLTFRLLLRELGTGRDYRRTPVRSSALIAILGFGVLSLMFFLAGVLAEAITPHVERVLDAVLPENFTNNYITLDMGHYGFDTTTNTIRFEMNTMSPDIDRFVPKANASNYEIVVGIRKEGNQAALDGEYKATIRNLKLETISTREWKPENKQELDMFLTDCVRFSIFGIAKSELAERPFNNTFRPLNYKSIKLFDSRSAGNHC